MRLRHTLVGTGSADDPFRVDLPTYTLLHVDYVLKRAVVEVPDSDHPFTQKETASLRLATPVGLAVGPLTPAMLKRWHDRLDERYVEHAGRFRPDPK